VLLIGGCAAKDVSKPEEVDPSELLEENKPVNCDEIETQSAPTIVGGVSQETDLVNFGVRASFRSNLIKRMVVERGGLSEGSVPVTGGGVQACYAVDLPENQSTELTVYGQDEDGCNTEKATFTVRHNPAASSTDTSTVLESSGRNIAPQAEVVLANGTLKSGSLSSLTNPVGDDEVSFSVSDLPGLRNDVKIYFNLNHVDDEGVIQNVLNSAADLLIGSGETPTHHILKVRLHWKTPLPDGTDIKVYVNEQNERQNIPRNRSVPDGWTVAGELASVSSDGSFVDIQLNDSATAIRHLFVSLARTKLWAVVDKFSLTEIELIAPASSGFGGFAAGQSGCLR